VTITLVSAAPALFPSPGYYALALDYTANSAIVTAAAPAQPGDLIILYAAGLGSTSPNTQTGEIPQFGAPISAFKSFQVLLNGQAIDPTKCRTPGRRQDSLASTKSISISRGIARRTRSFNWPSDRR
jgi:uncharacterized protein (TIGR03437 family)